MTRLKAALLMLLFGQTFLTIRGVNIEGALWLLGQEGKKKEIVLFFDVHDQEEFQERERQEYKDIHDIVVKYSQIEKKPLYILAEESWDIAGFERALGTLPKKLRKKPFNNISIENIEQRAASSALVDLIEHYPNHTEGLFDYRESCFQKVRYRDVTLHDVLDEYERIINPLKTAHANAVGRVKDDIYAEKLVLSIEPKYERIVKAIKNNDLPLDDKFEEVLNRLAQQGVPDAIKSLGEMVHQLFSALIDLYLLQRILDLPQDYKIVVLAGGDHSMYVKSEIMGYLGAKSKLRYGRFHSNVSVPLAKQQIVDLIFGKADYVYDTSAESDQFSDFSYLLSW